LERLGFQRYHFTTVKKKKKKKRKKKKRNEAPGFQVFHDNLFDLTSNLIRLGLVD